MKKLIALCIGILVFIQAHAYELIERDSIGIEQVGDKTFIIHQVDQGETLFAISRRYQVAINDILQQNEQLQDGLKINQRIRIPYINPTAVPEDSKLHRVSPGETLFSISKQYGIAVNDIMSWNDLKGNDLSVGQALLLKGVVESKPEPAPAPAPKVAEAAAPVTPAKNEKKTNQQKPELEKVEAKAKEEVKVAIPAASSPPAAPAAAENTGRTLPGNWISHTVVQGETLFSIAKAYDAKVDDLITWNSLASNNLSLGQKLKVGREPSSDVPVVTATVPIVVNNQRAEGQLSVPRTEAGTQTSTAYKNIKETGMAEVIEGTGNHKKYLVLHRSAPVGTIMRVRNDENDITIFARVVGKLPDTGDNSKLVIKLSKAAYDQLRAVNTRFPVEVSF